jgi:transposase-like protein
MNTKKETRKGGKRGEGEEGNQRRERHGLSASLLRSWWLAARSRLIRTTTEDDDITPLGSEIRLTVENPYADDRSRSGEE